MRSEKAQRDKPLAFVIMPFTSAKPLKQGYRPLKEDDLDTVYELIAKTLRRIGYSVRRSESPTDILRDIVLDLDRAELVVADITSLNPNVMYELGIRHGFCKKTVLITQDRNELPFDIAGYQCMVYGWVTVNEQRRFRKDLRDLLRQLDEHPDPRFGPVHTHIGSKNLGVQDEEHRLAIKRMNALLNEISYLYRTIYWIYDKLFQEFPDAVVEKEGQKALDFKKLPENLPPDTWEYALTFWPPTFPAIDLYLSTFYIPEGYNAYGDIDAFTSVIGSFRMGLHRYENKREHYLQAINTLECLSLDAIAIHDALLKRTKGKDLKLKSKQWLDTFGGAQKTNYL